MKKVKLEIYLIKNYYKCINYKLTLDELIYKRAIFYE